MLRVLVGALVGMLIVAGCSERYDLVIEVPVGFRGSFEIVESPSRSTTTLLKRQWLVRVDKDGKAYITPEQSEKISGIFRHVRFQFSDGAVFRDPMTSGSPSEPTAELQSYETIMGEVKGRSVKLSGKWVGSVE